MKGQVRVLVYHDTEDQEGIQDAYHQASAELIGVPGLVGNELLRSPLQPTKFVVASYWTSLESFQTWEQGPDHKAATAPLRPFQDKSLPVPYGIYEVDAAY
jgi:heme-degrading monooxygenase HmoA